MAVGLHGQHRHTHKTIQQRNGATTWTMAQTTDLLST